MQAPTFKTKGEIEAVTLAVAQLMRSWGLKITDWMVGKYLSHYFIGMASKPKDVIRDINLYVLKDKLPWRIKKQSRSIIPPAGRYFDQYNQLQTSHQVSLDFMPLPDEYLSAAFINRRRQEVVVRGERINLESAEKFIYRLEVLGREFSGKSAAEFREFYYADKKRYADRLAFYVYVTDFLRKIKRKDLVKRMQAVTNEYKKLIHWAYPELFEKNKKTKPQANEVFGSSIGSGKKKVAGIVKLYRPQDPLPRGGKKFVYVFTHFFPGDTKVLPHAKAIITDGGGLLSHAAIVCREIGMPCVVGTKNASVAFRDSDTVEIDLERGMIQKK